VAVVLKQFCPLREKVDKEHRIKRSTFFISFDVKKDDRDVNVLKKRNKMNFRPDTNIVLFY